jgi:hypothetical protein
VILNNASVQDASSVNVTAYSQQKVVAETKGVTSGAVGAGASFARVDIDGSTSATVGNNADIGTVSKIGSLNVSATSVVDARADVFAISGGAGAFNFNFAFVDVDPDVTAGIGTGADVEATGDVTVLAGPATTPTARCSA